MLSVSRPVTPLLCGHSRPNVIKTYLADPRFVNDEGRKPGLWISIRRGQQATGTTGIGMPGFCCRGPARAAADALLRGRKRMGRAWHASAGPGPGQRSRSSPRWHRMMPTGTAKGANTTLSSADA